MFASDLPQGEWSAVLVGDHWPGNGVLDLLAAAADARRRSTAHLHGYADHLRTVSQAHLAGQEGVAAEAVRHLFSRGEEKARAAAERNQAKYRSYQSAGQSVAALRDCLTQIAENGNATISRIQQSSAPTAAKIAGIVEVITDAQNQARTKTAEHAGTLLSEVQTVLDAQGADVSARAFAGVHGVDPVAPHPPCIEALTQQVTARLTAPAAGTADSGPTGDGATARPAPGDGAPAAERVTGAAAALSTGAGTLAAAVGSAIEASLTGGAIEGPGGSAEGPPLSSGDAAAAGPAAVPTGVPPIAASRPLPPSAGVTAAAAFGSSPAFGNSPTGSAPNPPAAPAPAARPAGAAAALNPTPAAAAGQSTLIRRVAAPATAAVPEHAVETPARPVRADHLTPLLAAVARQQPELRWAVGQHGDGTIVLVTDLAGGWIPPAVEIPAGVRLLEPAHRNGDLTSLLGDCPTVVTYQPGQQLPPDSPTPLRSTDARDLPATDDLGWELAQATKWRDGLPRLAHTLARAATAGTGWLDTEAALLRDQAGAAAVRVLESYPDAVDAADVGNWQLLTTIDALVGGRADVAAYHFAWFRAHSLAAQR